MPFDVVQSVHELQAEDWDALWPDAYPFKRHAFLAALEDSGSIHGHSGWQSRHLVYREGEKLLALLPLFLKNHSYGEYVFDWSWAEAYERVGLNYYPKLIAAVPFTPATGPRIGMAPHLTAYERKALAEKVFAEAKALAERLNCSGIHLLFPDSFAAEVAEQQQWVRREGCQYHWYNENYRDFEHFLESMNSRKRKNLRKERDKVKNQGFEFTRRLAADTTAKDWQHFYQLYHRTYLKRSRRPGYLGAEFFPQLARTMPNNLLLVQAHLQGECLAAAVYFRDTKTLYGRYWGALEDFDGLHFETCYYQGIDYAIREGLQRFDPGAQGEHKIQRGFQALRTLSFHTLQHVEFQQAVARYCAEEAQEIERWLQEARTYLPFREGHVLQDFNQLYRNNE